MIEKIESSTNVMISIIIPVYNTAAYLERCLQSVLEQNVDNIEIILVNDGSTDDSPKICNDYHCNHPEIKVIHQENSGLALSRKKGIENALGKYVLMLDSDDWLEKDSISILLAQIQKSRKDIICFQYKKINNFGKIIEHSGKKMKEEYIDCENLEEIIYHTYITGNISMGAVIKLVKKDILEKVVFKGNLAVGEEHDMTVQLFSISHEVRIIKAVLYNYYIRNNSISHSGYNEKYKNSLLNYINLKQQSIEMCEKYRKEIIGFYAEYEMSALTAMCRNENYDKDTIQILVQELRKDIGKIFRARNIKLYIKISAVMIIYSEKIFIYFFRKIYRVVGR